MRKLASIRRISEVRAIPGADAIECAVVDGWTVVIKKGEFRPDDYAIYCEVDSWIPHEVAPFLSKGAEPRVYNGVRGERLRSVKLRGQLSQGLLLNLDASWIIRNLGAGRGARFSDYEGRDVAELMNIQKWEAPIPAEMAGVVRGNWPTEVPKTDEERVQNLTREWDTLRNLRYEVTEKLEGSSMTVALIRGDFLVCSRNVNLVESESNTFWSMARRYDIEAKLRTLNLDNLAIQGELVGEGVQGNHYQLQGQDFYVYSIYDIARGRYLRPDERRTLTERLGLRHVPTVELEADIADKTAAEILLWADGKSQLINKPREGLVFKSVSSGHHWKAVSNAYLLKHG